MEVTLHVFDMDVQHLHPGFPQGIELPLPGLVILMVIGLVVLLVLL